MTISINTIKKNINAETINLLSKEYQFFLELHDLPILSADELLHEQLLPKGSDEYTWLVEFIKLWEYHA